MKGKQGLIVDNFLIPCNLFKNKLTKIYMNLKTIVIAGNEFSYQNNALYVAMTNGVGVWTARGTFEENPKIIPKATSSNLQDASAEYIKKTYDIKKLYENMTQLPEYSKSRTHLFLIDFENKRIYSHSNSAEDIARNHLEKFGVENLHEFSVMNIEWYFAESLICY